MRSLLILFAFPILSCRNATIESIAQKRSLDTTVTHPASTVQAPTEFIEYSKLTINGKINFDCRLSELSTLLGKPDSIVKTTDACGSAFDGDIYYYAHFNQTVAEVYRDSAAVSSVDLRDGKARLVHPDFILDRTTTLESLRKHFPEAVKAASPITTDIGDAIWINLQTDTEPTDFQWLLIFQKGKLVRVDLNTSC